MMTFPILMGKYKNGNQTTNQLKKTMVFPRKMIYTWWARSKPRVSCKNKGGSLATLRRFTKKKLGN